MTEIRIFGAVIIVIICGLFYFMWHFANLDYSQREQEIEIRKQLLEQNHDR